MSEKKRLLIVDALNLFIRSYVIIPTMDPSGIPIGGTIGFLKSLQKIMRQSRPHEVIICWDGIGGSQRKKQQNENYKEGRKPLRFNRRMIELDPKSQKQNKIHQQNQPRCRKPISSTKPISLPKTNFVAENKIRRQNPPRY